MDWPLVRLKFARNARRRGWIFLAALLCGALYLHRTRAPAPSPNTSFAVVQDLALTERPDGLFFTDVSRLPRAEVVRVVDGDTLKILWQGRTESLRYYGVNTPEKDEACFQEATERNRQLAGASVRLAFDERPKDRYGRLLAYVFSEEGKSIDAQLVSEGWGRAWKRDGRLRDQLIPLEQKARRARVGCLWTENNSRAENGKRKRRVRARREG